MLPRFARPTSLIRRTVVAPATAILLFQTMTTLSTISAAADSKSNNLVLLPSTLTGPPVCKLAPPGTCQFGAEPQKAKLLQRTVVSASSAVLRFELPDTTQPLQLSTCACLLARAQVAKQDDEPDIITRPYTPISTNANDIGYLDLLVKRYDQGKMSSFLHSMKVGDVIEFLHIDKNVKIQAPFDYDTIVMLVGGTGITPMIQALHAILGSTKAEEDEEEEAEEADTNEPRPPKKQKHEDETTISAEKKKKKTTVVLLYGSRTSDDILGRELLHQWASSKEYQDQFTCIDILSDEPADSDWKGARGYIDQSMIQQYAPSPTCADKFCFFVCGPPVMYGALCGPRDEANKVSGLLGKMGYQPHQVYKF